MGKSSGEYRPTCMVPSGFCAADAATVLSSYKNVPVTQTKSKQSLAAEHSDEVIVDKQVGFDLFQSALLLVQKALHNLSEEEEEEEEAEEEEEEEEGEEEVDVKQMQTAVEDVMPEI
ncbi:uncharacterized protein V6R79_012879 [Siganus canaliculatus]